MTTESNRTIKFGAWLRKNRRERRLSLNDLADMTGLSRQYLSVLERAAPQGPSKKPANPSRETVTALAKAFGSPAEEIHELAGYSADVEQHSILEGVVLRFGEQTDLNDEQRKSLISVVRLVAYGVVHERCIEWLAKAPNRNEKT